MSSPIDELAQNASLDAMLGDGAAASMPTSWEVALFNGDPANGGTELTSDGGYARPVIANDSATWPDADGGEKLSEIIDFDPPTDAWSDTATHYLLIDAADSTTQWFPGTLLEPMTIFGTETAVRVQLSLVWNVDGIV